MRKNGSEGRRREEEEKLMLLNCCCYCHCCRVGSYDDAKATHRASSETWSWHVKVNIQSLLLCPISDSHSRIFLQPFTSLDIFLPASSFFHLTPLSSAISPNACAGVCVSIGKKILFGYSYVNRVSQQEKSKCVTMRYAHKIRVYGSKTFYRSRVRVRVCVCVHVFMSKLFDIGLTAYAWWRYSKICTFLHA